MALPGTGSVALSQQEVEHTIQMLLLGVQAARRRRIWRSVAVLAIIALVVVAFIGHVHLIGSYWWVFKIFAGIWAADAAVSSRRSAAQKLAQAEDPRAIGVLAVVARDDADGDVRGAARVSLAALLPRVKSSDATAITPQQMDALLSLAHGASEQFALALLSALEQIGGERAIPLVEEMMLDSRVTVRNRAAECLPYVKERARQHEECATLLRASVRSTATAPRELLRPAAAGEQTPPDELLRSTSEG